MAQLFANNAYGVLAGTVNGAATLLVLVSGQGARFPAPTNGDHFLATLVGLDANGAENVWEIVKCTERSTDQLTVVRAQEGTTATTWNAGTRIELRLTAGSLGSLTNATEATQTALNAKVAASGGTASGLTLNDGYTEEVFAVTSTTPVLTPTNGSIQTWALTGNSTPTVGPWNSGQSMTLMVDDGTARTINWASMSITWKTGGGTAPTLLTSGYTVIELVKVGSTIYGWLAGDA